MRGTGEETGTTLTVETDSYGYRWMILHDPDVEDLVVGINAVSDALAVGGYGDRTLAAVFAFKDSRDRPLYLIYNYKRGTWYPFVPGLRRAGARRRARAADEGDPRQRAARRAGARALVPALGHPDLMTEIHAKVLSIHDVAPAPAPCIEGRGLAPAARRRSASPPSG